MNVDMIVTDSLSLRPHVMSPSERVAKRLKMSYNLNPEGANQAEIPIIDLSWVTQCIVQRQRLDYTENSSYYLNTRLNILNTHGLTDRPLKLFSLKVDQVRYEVMDLIRFGRNSHLSIGRIIAIHHHQKSKKNKIEVQVMEVHNNIELMDGGDSTQVVIDESELAGHVVMLSGKDFNDISRGWAEETNFSDLFVQMKP